MLLCSVTAAPFEKPLCYAERFGAISHLGGVRVRVRARVRVRVRVRVRSISWGAVRVTVEKLTVAFRLDIELRSGVRQDVG